MHSKILFHRRFTRRGAPPGEYTITPDAPRPCVHVIRYSEGSLEEFCPASAADVLDHVPEPTSLARGPGVTWIDVQGLGDRELLESLAGHFKLHPLAVADVVNIGQRPKTEDYADVLFCVLRMGLIDAGAFRWEQVSVFIGRGWVLTFQEQEGDCLDPLRNRLRQGRPILRKAGADYLGVMVLDAIVDGYFPVLDAYAERLEELEAEALASHQREVIERIYKVKRELMAFRRSVWPLRDALGSLLRDGHELITQPTTPYLRDVADHAMQIVDVLETHRELASSLVEIHLSSVANHANEIMRTLTVLASIFIPLTFIAGIYGMNFDDSPYNLPELHWKYGYIAFWATCLVVTGALLLLFRRLGWIGRRLRRGRPGDPG